MTGEFTGQESATELVMQTDGNRYDFQRSGAEEVTDPRARIRVSHPTGRTVFNAGCVERNEGDGASAHVVGPDASLTYTVLKDLDGQQTALIAGKLANILFDVAAES
jgi:hypothetical protein